MSSRRTWETATCWRSSWTSAGCPKPASPTARFSWATTKSPKRIYEHVTSRIGAFSGDNRAGLTRTLHRISAIRNREGKIVGLPAA